MIVPMLVAASLATASPSAGGLLAAWDAERASAWAAGDVTRLRSLYTEDSPAGDRDAARLQRWVDRGLTVTGLRTQLLSVREERRTGHRRVLTVTDRVVGGSAGGVPLPGDTPSTWTVVLRWEGGEWLVGSVVSSGR